MPYLTSLLLGRAEKAVSYSMVVVVAAQPHPTPSEEEEESGLVRATTVSGFSMYVLLQGEKSRGGNGFFSIR